MTQLPNQFITNISEVLGAEESGKLIAALDTESPTSIRFNPFKLAQAPEGERIPWSKYGYYLDQRPQFTLDPMFHAGVYYVQEASSMFIEHAYRQATGDSGEGLRVLDLCAAPGGKTTLLSTLVGLDGVVIANEVIRQRALTLADNVQKWGLGNVVVTNNDPSHFSEIRDFFDVIVVDAPCSGEGMFRKDHAARAEWSEQNVALCSARQRRILSEVWRSLKPGGVLIYSTCTFNRSENEENIEWLASEYECEPVAIEIDPSWGIAHTTASEIECFRFYPHNVRGEGFFCSVLRKADGKIRTKLPKPRRQPFSELSKQQNAAVAKWVLQPEFMHFAQVGDNIYGYYRKQFHTVKIISEILSVVHSGILMGQLFSMKLKPEHSLAMFHDLNRESFSVSDVVVDVALDYLRKKDVSPTLFDEGINLVTCDGVPLGWVKRIGHRVNNLYPKELRIINL